MVLISHQIPPQPWQAHFPPHRLGSEGTGDLPEATQQLLVGPQVGLLVHFYCHLHSVPMLATPAGNSGFPAAERGPEQRGRMWCWGNCPARGPLASGCRLLGHPHPGLLSALLCCRYKRK